MSVYYKLRKIIDKTKKLTKLEQDDDRGCLKKILKLLEINHINSIL